MASNAADDAFARNLLLTRVVTPEQVDEGRAEQRKLAQQGTVVSLPETLVKLGLITEAIRSNVEKMGQGVAAVGLQSLGQYKLLKKLGEGGMGAVYLAEDTLVGRKVALKVLPKRLAGDGEFLTRFKREARATGQLNHENIVTAYTFGEELGFHYYVMEYCEGEPLDKLLKREKFLPWDKAIGIVIQVAKGLKHAHQHGIIHRDIKPANVFLTTAGTAKILDMGLAKYIFDEEASFNTRTGMTLGTPHYIAPEQARGDRGVDVRADIYSLGATFYNLVTGETPFHGSSPAVIMMKHLNEQITNPQDIREDIPDGVAQVIQKMMAKQPDDRYQTCAELLDDLDLVAWGKMPNAAPLEEAKSSISSRKTARSQGPPPVSPSDVTYVEPAPPIVRAAPAPSSQKRLLVLAGVAAAAVLLAVGVFQLLRTPPVKNVATIPAASDKPSTPAGTVAIPDAVPKATSSVTPRVVTPPPPVANTVPVKETAPEQPQPPATIEAWIKAVRALPPEEQLQKVAEKIQELNPQWDGKYNSRIENGQVASLSITSDKLSDISPVRALAGLQSFGCEGVYIAYNNYLRNQVSDLSPIKDLPITKLRIGMTSIKDLKAAEGMQLEELFMIDSLVEDLTPVGKAPLKMLQCMSGRVASLAPLAENSTLWYVNVYGTPVRDINPLAGKPLRHVVVSSHADSIRVLVGAPLEQLEMGTAKVTDFSPLKEMGRLKTIVIDRRHSKTFLQLLPQLPNITKINDLSPSEFYASAAPAGAPLLIYEDFERLEAAKLPAGWKFDGDAGQVTLEDQPGRGRVLRVGRRAGTARGPGLKIDLDIERLRGNKLLASVSAICPKGYARAASSQPSLTVAIVDQEGRRKESGMGIWPDELQWKKLGYAKLIPSDTQKVELWLRISDVAAETFFDDLKIEALPEKGEDLLSYEDFDEFNPDKLPHGWSIQGGEYFSVADMPGRGRVLRMTHDADKSKQATVAISLPVEKAQGRVLRATFLAYCPNGYTPSDVAWHDPRGIVRWQHSDTHPGERLMYVSREPSNWKMYKIEKEIPANAKVLVFYLQCFQAADVYFDDLKIELLPAPVWPSNP